MSIRSRRGTTAGTAGGETRLEILGGFSGVGDAEGCGERHSRLGVGLELAAGDTGAGGGGTTSEAVEGEGGTVDMGLNTGVAGGGGKVSIMLRWCGRAAGVPTGVKSGVAGGGGSLPTMELPGVDVVEVAAKVGAGEAFSAKGGPNVGLTGMVFCEGGVGGQSGKRES